MEVGHIHDTLFSLVKGAKNKQNAFFWSKAKIRLQWL